MTRMLIGTMTPDQEEIREEVLEENQDHQHQNGYDDEQLMRMGINTKVHTIIDVPTFVGKWKDVVESEWRQQYMAEFIPPQVIYPKFEDEIVARYGTQITNGDMSTSMIAPFPYDNLDE